MEEMRMELTYYRKGDYLFPNLTIENGPVNIGKYGMLRKTFLKENRKNWYQSMLLTGKLEKHLMEIEKAAQERMEVLMNGLLIQYPAPDKEADQMKWVAHMNNLQQMAEESVLTELVYN
ncbi:MAG: TnpV protein [Mediterraneibacter gnavus]